MKGKREGGQEKGGWFFLLKNLLYYLTFLQWTCTNCIINYFTETLKNILGFPAGFHLEKSSTKSLKKLFATQPYCTVRKNHETLLKWEEKYPSKYWASVNFQVIWLPTSLHLSLSLSYRKLKVIQMILVHGSKWLFSDGDTIDFPLLWKKRILDQLTNSFHYYWVPVCVTGLCIVLWRDV